MNYSNIISVNSLLFLILCLIPPFPFPIKVTSTPFFFLIYPLAPVSSNLPLEPCLHYTQYGPSLLAKKKDPPNIKQFC